MTRSGGFKTAGAIWRSPFLEFRRRPPLEIFESALEEKFEPAVVISRQGGHNAFLANFAPITLVEQVADTGEHSGSPFPKPKFGRQIPNVVGGNKAFKGIAIVPKFIVNERAKKREFESILVAINRAGLFLIIRSVRRRFAVVRSGGKLGVQQRDVAVEGEVAVGAWCAAVDERENVQLRGGFKPNVTGVADFFGRCKTVRQNNLADLVIQREVETAYVEIQVRERFSANSIFELKRLPFLQVAVDDTARAGRHQLAVSDWAISLRHCPIKFNARRAKACYDQCRRIFGLGTLFSCNERRREDRLTLD